MVTTQFELQAMKVCMEEGMTMSNFFDEKICGKERERGERDWKMEVM